jgi:hypothetical protein
MTGSTARFDYTARSPLRRRALGLALASYLVLFAAGVIALVGLAVPVGRSPAIVAAVGVALLLAGIGCWAVERFGTAREPVPQTQRNPPADAAVSEHRPSQA